MTKSLTVYIALKMVKTGQNYQIDMHMYSILNSPTHRPPLNKLILVYIWIIIHMFFNTYIVISYGNFVLPAFRGITRKRNVER